MIVSFLIRVDTAVIVHDFHLLSFSFSGIIKQHIVGYLGGCNDIKVVADFFVWTNFCDIHV